MATTQQLRESYPELISRWPTSSTDPRCDYSKAVPVTFLCSSQISPSRRITLKVHPATRQIWRAFAAVLLHHDYEFRETAGGTVSCRKITGGSRTSLHAHGIAADWNPSKNRYRISTALIQWGKQTDMPPAMVRAIESIKLTNGLHPLEWGGRWSNIKDPMHYELDQLQSRLAPVNLSSLPAGAWSAYLAFEKGSPLPPEGEEEMLYGLDIGKPGDPSPADAPAHRVLQAFLVRQGQDIGAWGPHGDGVDGRPGDDTRAGLHRWKVSAGITPDTSAGDGKIGDYELAAIYAAGGSASAVDQTARAAAASADQKATAARTVADRADAGQTRANQTLDKIRSE